MIGGRGWGILLGVCVAAAVLGRWPLSLHPHAIPLDPNTGLHALTVDAIAHGSFTRVYALEYPDGAPIRLIGLPPLLLAVPFASLLGPAPALELARTIWLALQGVAVGALAARLGLGTRGATVAGALATLNPFVLHASGNGQHENVALAPLALVVGVGLAGTSAGTTGALSALAIVATGFCSPYHVMPAGVLLVAAASTRGRSAFLAAVTGAAVGGAGLGAYYAGALATSGTWGRPMTEVAVPAPLFDLVWPRASLIAGPVATRPVAERLSDAVAPIATFAFDAAWPFEMPASAPYLGVGLLVLGAAGLWRARDTGPLRRLALAGIGCLVLAMGARLHLTAEDPTGLPLPWALVAWAPGIGSLSSTTRFLSGAVLVLTLGGGALAARHAWAVWFVPLALADALLVAPIEWPIRAARTDLDAIVRVLPDGPVAAWPSAARVTPQLHALLSLLLDRPLVLPPDDDPGRWRERITRAGARGVVQLLPAGRSGPPWPEAPIGARGECAGKVCVSVPAEPLPTTLRATEGR